MFSLQDTELIMGFLELVKNQDSKKLADLENILSASDKEIHKLDDLLTFMPASDMVYSIS